MDEKIRKIILQGPIGRALLTLSLPIIAGNLLQTGYQLTDAFWGAWARRPWPPSRSAFP